MTDPAQGPMNVDPVEEVQRRVVKRKNCDVEGNEQPDAKKNKATPDARKHTIICFLIHLHFRLLKLLNITELFHIDLVADVTSIVSTFHTIKRQSYSQGGKVESKVTLTSKPSIGGYIGNVTLGDMFTEFNNLIKSYGISYEKKVPGEVADTGLLSSLLALTAFYKGRVSEVRTGNLKFTYKKSQDEVREIALSVYGLDNGAAAFMAGANLNPTIQSSMKQSLGPMTIALQLCNCRESKFQKSWKDVFCQVFANIPRKEEIAQILAGSTNQHKSILKLLYQFSMMGATRSSNKAAIPMSFLLAIMKHFNPFLCNEMEKGKSMLTPEQLDPLIQELDFSGKGFWHLWNSCAKQFTWTIRGDPEVMTSEFASQITTHAVLGTHKEDLEVLRHMFGVPFVDRKTMGACFLNKNTRGTVDFKLKEAKIVAKFASAAQTKLFDGSEGQYARCCVISASASLRVNIDSKFMKKVRENPGVLGAAAMPGEDSIIRSLIQAKEKAISEIGKSDMISYGTTSWYNYSSESKDSYGEKSDVVLSLSGKYFFGREDD